MTLIPDEVIEQVRDAADLVDLIGEHVELRKTGTDWRGPCPFHGGTNRNFAVIPRKQMFYCFVCHEAGDVFTFLMKRFGMDYPTAVREVARRVGVTIPERQATGPDPREPLFGAVAAAHEWYARQFRESDDAAAARRYVTERGFDLEVLLPFGLGWAPAGPAFLAAMKTLGIAESTLRDAGLAVEREDGSLRPRFWNRLLFPIHDLHGRVVGFGGRVLGDGEPKYLNSPESEVFHKGRLLYHLHDAKHAIRSAEQALLVEGYFDVLRLVTAGVEYVVAPLGTGFTPEQAALLARRTKQVVLLFDSDTAGLKATFRTADALLAAGVNVQVATMPPGEDPDTLVAQGGADAVRQVLDDAMDVLERKVQLLEKRGWLESLSGRRKALDRLLPTLRAVSDPVMRDLYVGRVAEALGIAASTVAREAAERARGARPPAAPPASRPEGTPPADQGQAGAERDLVQVLLHRPDLREGLAERLPERRFLREPERTLIERLAAWPADRPVSDLFGELDGAAHGALAHVLEQPWNPEAAGAMREAALRRLDGRRVEAEMTDVRRRMAVADGEEKEALTRRFMSLRSELSQLVNARWNPLLRGRSSAR